MNDSEHEELNEEFLDESEGEAATIRRLRENLKKTVAEKQEYLDGWQRARADFANYKKEEARIHADREDRTKAHCIETLLPALDTLELSLKHDASPTLLMIEKQFLDALKQFGVERFGKEGDAFDPHIHEALAHEGEGTHIVKIERSGYKAGAHIIRAAQVII